MCSVRVDPAGSVVQALERLEACPPSRVSHHGQGCCLLAREWLLSMDLSLRGDGGVLGGPRWIRDRYGWGPSTWPLHWCQVVELPHLDCGALAALAREVLAARGLATLPVQLLQAFSPAAARHWRRRWGARASEWIVDEVAYHEACAVVEAGHVKIWDPTDNRWILPDQFPGYGATAALRVGTGQDGGSKLLTWGDHPIRSDVWTVTPWFRQLAASLPSGNSPGR